MTLDHFTLENEVRRRVDQALSEAEARRATRRAVGTTARGRWANGVTAFFLRLTGSALAG